MNIKRSYKFRFYPTSEQEDNLAKTFGCVRFVYNETLRIRTDAWFERKESIGYHKSSAMLTLLKREEGKEWLQEVSSVTLQQELRHLQSAFQNFWAKRSRYPKFKKKNGKQSATYVGEALRWHGKQLKLAKQSEPLNIVWSRDIPKDAVVTSVTVSKDCSGRYFVSFVCDDAVLPKKKVKSKVGVDLGLSSFATMSTGEKVDAQSLLRKHEKKLAKLQRILSRKQNGSNNRNKARLKVAKLHAKIADTRNDFLHKLSTRLINENQVIAVESLSVKNMQKNHCLAKSISDASWGEFLRQLEYKASWYGRALVAIDKWYPSSKRCNDCGYILQKMQLSVREWKCPECGALHDRDINASKNILAVGLAVLANGEDVRPVCASAQAG